MNLHSQYKVAPPFLVPLILHTHALIYQSRETSKDLGVELILQRTLCVIIEIRDSETVFFNKDIITAVINGLVKWSPDYLGCDYGLLPREPQWVPLL